jgi:hypothetical protein
MEPRIECNGASAPAWLTAAALETQHLIKQAGDIFCSRVTRNLEVRAWKEFDVVPETSGFIVRMTAGWGSRIYNHERVGVKGPGIDEC